MQLAVWMSRSSSHAGKFAQGTLIVDPTFVCNLQGLDIKQHMRDIPQNCDPAPIICIYVDLNLQTLHKAGIISWPQPFPAGSVSEAGPNPSSSSMQTTSRGSSPPLGLSHSSNSLRQLPAALQHDRTTRTASGAVEHASISPTGSLTSPGSQASTINGTIGCCPLLLQSNTACYAHCQAAVVMALGPLFM